MTDLSSPTCFEYFDEPDDIVYVYRFLLDGYISDFLSSVQIKEKIKLTSNMIFLLIKI